MVDPQLDESQAGFRFGAEEHVYTLAETLRVRCGRRTFCASVDVRKAFDIAWRDAVLLKLAEMGIAGGTWAVITDLPTDTTARALVKTENAGVRQRSVLGPLLFNIFFFVPSRSAEAARLGTCYVALVSTKRYVPVMHIVNENNILFQWSCRSCACRLSRGCIRQ